MKTACTTGTIRRVSAVGILAGLLASAPHALANSNGVVIESVNLYGATNCTQCGSCSGYDICNSVANGDGFLNAIVATGQFSQKARWTNTSVYDSDFQDPEKISGGADTYNFDPSGAAISYYTGHGAISNQAFTYVNCITVANCNAYNPPSGTWYPASCVGMPANYGNYGRCIFTEQTNVAVNGAISSFGNQVAIGGTFGYAMRLGDSGNSGGWAGAGTNGGTNLVVLDESYPSIVGNQYWSLVPPLAGAHIIAVTQPTWGDTRNVADRGAAFGARGANNLSGSVSQAWLDSLNDLPQADGTGCLPNNDFSKGGGHGFNGCGCNLTVVADSSQYYAQHHTTESWYLLQLDTWDATGNGWWYWAATCNYDAFGQYPFSK